MKKMSKKLETLLIKMGFEKVNSGSRYEVKRYEKNYGLALISVYELFDDMLDKGNQNNTYWDVNIIPNNNAATYDELLSSSNNESDGLNNGKTIKEYKQSMMDLFNDLEIINQLF